MYHVYDMTYVTSDRVMCIQILNAAAASRKRKWLKNLHRVRDLRANARLDESILHCTSAPRCPVHYYNMYDTIKSNR